MQLTMRKGQEHRLVINQRLDDPNELMYSAYQQALDALNEIVRQARVFRSSDSQGDRTNGDPELHCYDPSNAEREKKNSGSKLYGYAHNIITFSGSRGQGKTSAMLSFSDAMHNHSPRYPKLPHSSLEECSFTVLEPFDPTILEENQSILAVVLSRMYRLAEENWRKSECSRREADKNDLLDMFQKCLSGINAIKFRKGEEIKTLHTIHEISDSSLLKDNFYQLTELLLRFVNAGARDNSFLVIQLDDTDFQIRKGYEILEDIRKYLTLPNIIILMATDLDMLHHALIQHFINEFEPGLKREIVSVNDLRKLERKYLDKLIPPTFTIYLPHLDDVIRQRNELVRLAYIDPEKEAQALREYRSPVNLLLKEGCPCKTEDLTFQALLLRYIYRKTRIVFAEHSSYLHDLIPTTLRGLAQFLGLLSSMEDVPELDKNDPRLDDPRALARVVQRQVVILEVNLPLFESYFLKDWVHTKLPRDKAEVIERLSAALPEQRCPLAVELLEGLYGAEDTEYPADYTRMVRLLEKLKKAHRRTEDFYFFFAVRTVFTIQGHKAVVRQKRRAVRAFMEEKHAGEWPLLLFDFSPESTGLPVWFEVPSLPDKVGYNTMCGDIEPKYFEEFERAIGSSYASRLLIYRHPLRINQLRFSILHLIRLFMSLGSPEGKKLAVGGLSQRDLYLAQTSAATIAINWDVQDKLLKLPKSAFEISGDSMPQYPGALRLIWKAIDRAIESINACKLPGNPCPMITSCTENMVNFIGGGEGLQRVLRGLEIRLGENCLKEICELYKSAQQLRLCVQEEEKALEKLENFWTALVDVCYSISPKAREQFDLPLLSDMLRAYLNSDTPDEQVSAKDNFTGAVDDQLKNLCEHFGYTTEQIEKVVNGGEVL